MSNCNIFLTLNGHQVASRRTVRLDENWDLSESPLLVLLNLSYPHYYLRSAIAPTVSRLGRVLPGDHQQSAKVAFGQVVLASSSAPIANLANITSLLKLPQSLQAYLDGAANHLSTASDYARSATGLSSTALYATVGIILVLGALPSVVARKVQAKGKIDGRKPGTMSRYGWSSRPQLSPYSSALGSGSGTVPVVTDDDYSYVTSQDIEDQGFDEGRMYDYDPRQSHGRLARADTDPFEDDVLLIERSKGEFLSERFPPYSIGDGKLLVGDVLERIKLVRKLSDRQARQVKLLYKGRQMKDPEAPVRHYGVKNNSRLMVVLADPGIGGTSDVAAGDVVVIEQDKDKPKSTKKKRRGRRQGSDDGGSSAGLGVPRDGTLGGSPTSRAPSPGSAVSGASGASAAPGGPIDKLNAIAENFTTNLLPPCVQFIRNPPSDPTRREEEFMKLSETVMQHVILKLDAIDHAGDEAVRIRRREIVNQAQDVLKELDRRRSG